MYRLFRIIISITFISILLYWVLSIRPYRISGDSMTPSLKPEGIAIIDKVSPRIYWIKRGDIIVYTSQKEWIRIKRVVWLPGEKLQIENGNVNIWWNDKYSSLEEKYLNEHIRTCVPGACIELSAHDYDIPNNTYFVLWDNRENSRDSRWCSDVADCKNKTPVYIPLDDIVGRVIFSW
jgi:signal peptidase I